MSNESALFAPPPPAHKVRTVLLILGGLLILFAGGVWYQMTKANEMGKVVTTTYTFFPPVGKALQDALTVPTAEAGAARGMSSLQLMDENYKTLEGTVDQLVTGSTSQNVVDAPESFKDAYSTYIGDARDMQASLKARPALPPELQKEVSHDDPQAAAWIEKTQNAQGAFVDRMKKLVEDREAMEALAKSKT